NRIPVTVKDENGNGVYNFECRLFKGDELIALASTDANGEAELCFAAVNNTDVLDLYITGMNGWPQHLELGFDNANCAHVLFDNYALNDPDGQVDFGESQTLNVGFRNVGNLAANNVTATLSCDAPYITVTQGSATIGTVDSHATVSLDNAFSFNVSDDVPDQTIVTFILTCTNGNETWESLFDMTVNAPDYGRILTQLEEVDGDGNGHADSGETLTLHFTGKNTGHSLSPNTVFGVYCSAPEILFDQNTFIIGDLAIDDTFTVDFTLSIAEARNAQAFELILATYSGHYVVMDSYFLNVNSEMEDFETGDFSKYDWQFEGQGGWEIVSHGPYEGLYCAHTTSMGHSSHADMSLDYDFACDNEISFYVRTSTETGYDFLVFYVDGERYGRWSGQTGWTYISFMIPEGTHHLTWSYEKDGGATGGQDCVWVDNIVLPPMEVVLDVHEDGPSTSSGSFTVYPNPTNGILGISVRLPQCDSPTAKTYRITNLMGQTLLTGQIIGQTQQIDVSNLPKGMYFITFAGETHKFVVR
ncbi:MAG: hypothetical protein F083_2425, partial [bacterium F083]